MRRAPTHRAGQGGTLGVARSGMTLMHELARCPSTRMVVSTGRALAGPTNRSASYVCPLCRDRHYPRPGQSWLAGYPSAANADPLSEAC